MIQAVMDKVIVEVLKEDEKTEAGIIVPDAATKQPQLHGKVLSVGETISTIKPNEIVMCHRAGGQDILYKGKIYKVLAYGEVYGIVRE
jgi:chaperonin GroES